MRSVYPGTTFYIDFDETKDLYISADFSVNGQTRRPLEFAGTGFLHVVQLFSYLVLFQPRVLLIDEPESHLHPTLQTKLTRELRRRTAETGTVGLITTHSPFVARALPLGSGVILVKSGGITESRESELIKRALGWGALDKRILLCTEDGKAEEISELVKQIGDIDNLVSVFPFNGVDSLGHAPILAELRQKLGGQHRVVVHRDRDGRSEAEIASWRKAYADHQITPWVTEGSDLEMYFCLPHYVASLYGWQYEETLTGIEKVIADNNDVLRGEFLEKRKQINRIYEKTGGSPSSDQLILDWHWSKWVRGKSLLPKVRQWVRSRGVDEKLLGRANEDLITGIDLMQVLYKVAAQ